MPETLISRLKAFLEREAPPLLEILSEGASEEEILAAENAMGIRFPDDFRAIYRECNGVKDQSFNLNLGGEWLTLSRIVDEWEVWKGLLDKGTFKGIESRPRGPIKNDWWNPKWIPLTYNGAGDHDCLDLDPAEGGKVGQIISFWHDVPSRTLQAVSFGDWFENFVSACERGDIVYSEDEECLLDKDDLE